MSRQGKKQKQQQSTFQRFVQNVFKKPDKFELSLFKVYIFSSFFLAAIFLFVGFQVLNSDDPISTVEAAEAPIYGLDGVRTEWEWAEGDNPPPNEAYYLYTEQLRDENENVIDELTEAEKNTGVNCFYDSADYDQHGSHRCSAAAFENLRVCEGQPNKMAVCRTQTLNGNTINLGDHTYGIAECQDIRAYCGTADYPATCDDKQHTGIFPVAGCRNPYYCEKEPSTTPTEPPQETPTEPPQETPTEPPNPGSGRVVVRTACVDGDPDGRDIDLTATVANYDDKSDSFVVGGSITFDNIPENDNYFSPNKNAEVNLDVTRKHPDLEIVSNTCSNGDGSGDFNWDSAECQLEFEGCQDDTPTPSVPTGTPPPPNQNARCEFLSANPPITPPGLYTVANAPRNFVTEFFKDQYPNYEYGITVRNLTTGDEISSENFLCEVSPCMSNYTIPENFIQPGSSYQVVSTSDDPQVTTSSCINEFSISGGVTTTPTPTDTPDQAQCDYIEVVNTLFIGAPPSTSVISTVNKYINDDPTQGLTAQYEEELRLFQENLEPGDELEVRVFEDDSESVTSVGLAFRQNRDLTAVENRTADTSNIDERRVFNNENINEGSMTVNEDTTQVGILGTINTNVMIDGIMEDRCIVEINLEPQTTPTPTPSPSPSPSPTPTVEESRFKVEAYCRRDGDVIEFDGLEDGLEYYVEAGGEQFNGLTYSGWMYYPGTEGFTARLVTEAWTLFADEDIDFPTSEEILEYARLRTGYPELEYEGGDDFIKNQDRNTIAEFVFTNCDELPPDPDIDIDKVLVSDDGGVVGTERVFNIVATNTGNVDIAHFAMGDTYDPEYLSFIEADAVEGPGIDPRNPISMPTPDVTQEANGFQTLTWDNLPLNPENAGSNENQPILTPGDRYVVRLRFETIRPTTDTEPEPIVDGNDNCAVITDFIVIIDGEQEEGEFEDGREPEDCEEFNVPEEPGEIVVRVDKYSLTPVVKTGDTVRFQAVLSNIHDQAYIDVDFIDQYDSTYLDLQFVKVAKVGSIDQGFFPIRIDDYAPVIVTAFDSIDPIVINNVQNLGSPNFGPLGVGESFVFEIFFTARAGISSTCDVVDGNVRDEDGDMANDDSYACTKINIPTSPKLGSSFWLNSLIAGTVWAAAGVAIKRYNL